MAEHSLLELDLSILFLLSVILIWFMIAYQLVLTLAGFFHYRQSLREQRSIDARRFDFPKVSLLIPAHNEEKVIARTLDAMLKLEYPVDRLDILVINDGSSDSTQEIVNRYARNDARVRSSAGQVGSHGVRKSLLASRSAAHSAQSDICGTRSTMPSPGIAGISSDMLTVRKKAMQWGSNDGRGTMETDALLVSVGAGLARMQENVGAIKNLPQLFL